MPPPTKRRKRTIVESDDEGESNPPVNTLTSYLLSSPESKTQNPSTFRPESPSPTRKPPRHGSSQPIKPSVKPPSQSFPTNGSSSRGRRNGTSTSPGKSKTRAPARGARRDLRSLFSKQAERAAAKPSVKFDDIISDPISDDEEVGEHRASTKSLVSQASRRRFNDTPSSSATDSTAAGSKQKFLPTDCPRPPFPASQDEHADDDRRPWSERFGPTGLDELAVHKKKVADVRKWLEDVMAGRMRQRLLILKGAAGTGKTTALRLLARDMRCEILEWRNPTTSYGGPLGYQSASAQFEEFMGRGGKFAQLDFGLDDSASKGSATGDETRKIMLIEEFPNTFARSSTAMTSFRKSVLQFLATNTPSLSIFANQTIMDSITPVIMIISETLLTTTSAAADSFTAHRLLGPEITRHPGTCIIEFNAIAPTLLAAALELVVQKEARLSHRRRTPGLGVLKKLGEIGDIRSAISALQFLCLKGDGDANWGAEVKYGKPKRSIKASAPLTTSEKETLEAVSQREASLGIFHAIGKVVYNKREATPMDPGTDEGKAEILPDHMVVYSRPRKSEVSVDSLIDETGTDTHTFISALHENYVLSCAPDQSDQMAFLNYMGGCIDDLSDSDLLCPSWDIFFGGRGAGASGYYGRDSASHVLRQEELAFQVATRGLLFHLPRPVNRIATGSRRGGDAFKMFYPTSLKLWREKEELESLVDHWSSTLLKGDNAEHDVTNGASAFRRPNSTANDTSSQRDLGRSKESNLSLKQTSGQSTALLSLGSSARREMLIDRLPYMSHISRGRRTPGSAVQLRDIERVVSFSGIGSVADDDAVDLDENAGDTTEPWATDRPTEESAPRKKGVAIRQSNHGAGSVVSLQVQKLVLSDDDIEDD
ncbi:Rad17 cell cycle checkpoint protein-domain-containing protein [Astrocystis sublimbata]|nr:Rad17 cell cycle checkpoint protein-domain-containing protein [Astrocystis sublimbata]